VIIYLKKSNPTPAIPTREGEKAEIFLKRSLVGRVWVGLSNSITQKHLILLFLLSRLAILPMLPWLSDDVFTYLWQGKLTSKGINVYTEMPESVNWAEYRDEVFYKMGNRNIPAIYPPLTVIINGTVHKIAEIFSDDWRFEFYLWKFILLISEFMAFIIFIKMIDKKDYIYPFIYCILPLSAIEIAGQGHNDGLLFVFLAILLYYLNSNLTLSPSPKRVGLEMKTIQFLKHSPFFRRLYEWLSNNRKIVTSIFTGIQIAFLTLIKIIPFAFIAVIAKMKLRALNKTVILLLSLIIILVFSMPFMMDYRAIEIFRNGQHYYNMIASFNSLPLILSRFVLEQLNINEWWKVAPYIVQISRILTMALAFFLIKPVDKKSAINALILFYLIPILISSKVHTWYFAPLVFLSLFNRNIVLAFAIQIFLFTYQYYLFIDKSIVPYFDVLVWLIAIVTYILINKENKIMGLKSLE
jgi:hypothetical protein